MAWAKLGFVDDEFRKGRRFFLCIVRGEKKNPERPNQLLLQKHCCVCEWWAKAKQKQEEDRQEGANRSWLRVGPAAATAADGSSAWICSAQLCSALRWIMREKDLLYLELVVLISPSRNESNCFCCFKAYCLEVKIICLFLILLAVAFYSNTSPMFLCLCFFPF